MSHSSASLGLDRKRSSRCSSSNSYTTLRRSANMHSMVPASRRRNAKRYPQVRLLPERAAVAAPDLRAVIRCPGVASSDGPASRLARRRAGVRPLRGKAARCARSARGAPRNADSSTGGTARGRRRPRQVGRRLGSRGRSVLRLSSQRSPRTAPGRDGRVAVTHDERRSCAATPRAELAAPGHAPAAPREDGARGPPPAGCEPLPTGRGPTPVPLRTRDPRPPV